MLFPGQLCQLVSIISRGFIVSAPVPKTNEPKRDEPEVCLNDELGEVEANEEEGKLDVEEEKREANGREKDHQEEEVEKEDEEEEDVEEDDSLGLEMRNTDSVFSELSELSRHYLESVDQGACVRGEPLFHICTRNSTILHSGWINNSISNSFVNNKTFTCCIETQRKFSKKQTDVFGSDDLATARIFLCT